MNRKEYFIFNVLLFVLLLLLFLATFIIDPSSSPISCQFYEATGQVCSSCGLTRDFVSFSHFDFQGPINKNSIYVYTFFLIQLCYRFFAALINKRITPVIMKLDLLISVVSIIAVFLPFWL